MMKKGVVSMMKKGIFLLIILAFAVGMSGCANFEPKIEELKKLYTFLEDHTVFKTSITVDFENEDDIVLFEKRLYTLGMEVVNSNECEKTVEYTVLSHYPIESETVTILAETANIALTNEFGKSVLFETDVVDIRYKETYVGISVTNMDERQFSEEDCFLIVDDRSISVRLVTTNEQSQYTFEIRPENYKSDDYKILFQKLAISYSDDSYLGHVEAKVKQPSKRVSEYMQEPSLASTIRLDV